MCGENVVALSSNFQRWGSSPRVRGKRATYPVVQYPQRLIPACAGKTTIPVMPGRPSGAHPRVCGENGSDLAAWRRSFGSSPRVRGKPSGCSDCLCDRGLIPACAGKTSCDPSRCAALRAHPRVCGENGRPRRFSRKAAGSSPRVRGKRARNMVAVSPSRLIPACAGKTCDPAAGTSGAGAHPRVCGENLKRTFLKLRKAGSSPRVRGKLGFLHALDGLPGLIPACAGKTRRNSWPARRAWAHPRVCGENERETRER